MKTKAINKKEQDFPVIPLIIIFFISLLAFAVGNKYLADDLSVILKWWLAIFAIGAAFFPLSHVIGRKFKDGGFVLSKGLGIAISSWIVWTLSTFRLQRFTTTNTIITLIVCAAICYFLYIFISKKKNEKPFDDIDVNTIAYMFFYEALFLLVFMGACYMRSFRVTITSDTEKYMDFGFLAAVLNAEYLPAEDMWFAGEPINYYYYGIYVVGYIARMIGTHTGYAYNLGLMTLAALGFLQVYQLTAELIDKAADEHDKRRLSKNTKAKTTGAFKRQVMMHSAGLLSGFAVFAAGNMQYVLYAKIYPFVQKRLLHKEPDGYWFPDATRFITDTWEGNEGTLIHEFPCYSFVLGDLHAHVTDIIFVFTIVPILFAFLLNRKERMEEARDFGRTEKVNLLKEALTPEVMAASFMIGIIKTANYWDFFIYFVVAGGMLFFSNAIVTGYKAETVNIKCFWSVSKDNKAEEKDKKDKRSGKKTIQITLWKDLLLMTLVQAVECLVIGFIISFPFNMNFDSPSAGIGLCYTHSNPYELAVLWALPIFVCIVLFVVAINTYKARVKELGYEKPRKGKLLKPFKYEKEYVMTKDKEIDHFNSFIFRLEFSDLFILILAACAMGLILVPELIYVRDIYGGSFSRTNTMFKLTYQAFMLFGMIMSYAIVRFIAVGEKISQRVIGIVCLFFLLWTCNYLDEALNAYTGDMSKPFEETRDHYARTLNSYNTISKTNALTPAEEEAIFWVLDNTEGTDVILQMGTTSYSSFASISAWTGRPTVCGWAYHEWLWRNGGTLEFPDCVRERLYFDGTESDVITIYTSDDEQKVRELIEKYDIKYIFVAQTETVNGMDSGSEKTKTVKGRTCSVIDTNHELLKSLGEVVFDGHTEDSYGYPTYIVKVDR